MCGIVGMFGATQELTLSKMLEVTAHRVADGEAVLLGEAMLVREAE